MAKGRAAPTRPAARPAAPEPGVLVSAGAASSVVVGVAAGPALDEAESVGSSRVPPPMVVVMGATSSHMEMTEGRTSAAERLMVSKHSEPNRAVKHTNSNVLTAGNHDAGNAGIVDGTVVFENAEALELGVVLAGGGALAGVAEALERALGNVVTEGGVVVTLVGNNTGNGGSEESGDVLHFGRRMGLDGC